jgi:hypothetical protein
VLNALENRTLAFDGFRNGYLYDLGAGYVFTEAPNGHLEPIFPIGTALLTAPIYIAGFALAQASGRSLDLTAPSFEPERLAYEKSAANLVAAAAAALLFLCAMRLATLPAALLSTVAFAFGSEMWTIGSQALWQHGTVALVTLAMLFALLGVPNTASRSRALLIAGVCAGFLPVVRPTALAFSLAGLAFALRFGGPRRLLFVLGGALGCAPGVAWNLAVFHKLVGGYAVNVPSYSASISQALTAVAGLLVSPNRGLLVFTPFVLFAAAGAVRAFRSDSPEAYLLRYCCIASLATFANYAFYGSWDGGAAFGPRFLTDLMPTAGLLLAFALPRNLPELRARKVFTGFAIVAIVVSCLVQLAGVNGEPKTDWSGIPFDVSTHPERIWQWRDNQIQRDALATYHLWTPNPTFGAAYAPGFDGSIGTIRTAGDVLTAEVQNTGTSRWYGYTTGMYFGQARVRVRYLDRYGNLAREAYLFIESSPRPGERAVAIGPLALPAKPGTYRAVFDIDAFQDPRIGERHAGARGIDVVVPSR